MSRNPRAKANPRQNPPGQPGIGDAPSRRIPFYARCVAIVGLAALASGCGPRAHIPQRPVPVPDAVVASVSQARTARALAPVLYLQRDESFRLERVVAVVHPERPIVAYHLLWRDDVHGAWLPFTTATDQEVVWVEHDGRGAPRILHAYWHGAILSDSVAIGAPVAGDTATGAPAAGAPAAGDTATAGDTTFAPPAADMPPAFNVQWGKHGSIPRGMGLGELPGIKTLNAFYALAIVGTPDIWLGNVMRQGPWCFCHGFRRYREFTRPLPLADRLDAVVVTEDPHPVLQAAFGEHYSRKPAWPWTRK